MGCATQCDLVLHNFAHSSTASLSTIKIGRKHKAHRQQLSQSKPWRESEKGRKGKKGKARRSTMGNEESHMVGPDTPPQTLKERSLEALGEYIRDGKARQIVVMVSWCAFVQLDVHSPLPLTTARQARA